jgi:Tfp pilus assembly protein PilO
MAAAPSIKRALIEKSNTTVVVVTSVATFIVIFALVAVWSLFGQFTYQQRVIGADQAALDQLKADIQSTQSLTAAYDAFTSTPTNAIGGDPNGKGTQDGTNAKIILDALPSKYDYPALVTSLENILTSQSVQIQSITGTDAVVQSGNQSSATPAPQPMPFQVVVTGNYASIQKVVTAFERSIRPFQVLTLELAGDQSQLTLTINAQTYWQPAKSLDITSEVLQ